MPPNITIIQKKIETPFSPLVRNALHQLNQIVLLPEYFYFNPQWKNYEDGNTLELALSTGLEIKQKLKDLSHKNQSLIIAGSILEKEEQDGNPIYFNRSHVFHNGEHLGFHTKFNLFESEKNLLTAGTGPEIIDTPFGNIAILICADVLSPGVFEKIKVQTPREGLMGIFCPTTSPRKEENALTRKLRDQDIYGRGARICQCPVFKSCATGTIRGNPLQGRSLIALPDGKIFNAKDIDSEEILNFPPNLP